MTYLRGDHLGSTTKAWLVGSAAASLERYMPFGNARGDSSVSIPYRFTGQRYAEVTWLYYYGARWYSPYLNRFVSADTSPPESFRTYGNVVLSPAALCRCVLFVHLDRSPFSPYDGCQNI